MVGHRHHGNVYLDPDELERDSNDGTERPEIAEEEDEDILTVEEVTFVNGVETTSAPPLRYFVTLS